MWVSTLALVYRKPVVLIVFRWVGGTNTMCLSQNGIWTNQLGM